MHDRINPKICCRGAARFTQPGTRLFGRISVALQRGSSLSTFIDMAGGGGRCGFQRRTSYSSDKTSCSTPTENVPIGSKSALMIDLALEEVGGVHATSAIGQVTPNGNKEIVPALALALPVT